MITLLLVEDELLVRQGLRMWLDRTLYLTVVGEASNVAEAMTLVQALHPQFVLIDLSTSPTEGITATAAIRRPCQKVRSCSSACTMIVPCGHEHR